MEDLWRIKERADDLWVAVNLNNRGLRVQARYRLTPASSQRELRTISQILNINVPVAARSIALRKGISLYPTRFYTRATMASYIFASLA